MFDNDHVAFVKVVVPIEPEIVDVPLSSTYCYKSARALDPSIAYIVNAAVSVSLPMVVIVESFIDFAFPMFQKIVVEHGCCVLNRRYSEFGYIIREPHNYRVNVPFRRQLRLNISN